MTNFNNSAYGKIIDKNIYTNSIMGLENSFLFGFCGNNDRKRHHFPKSFSVEKEIGGFNLNYLSTISIFLKQR